MMWHHWPERVGAWAGWSPGAIITFVLLAVIIGLLIWSIVALIRHGVSGQAEKGNVAMEITRERYARGEISKEEFDQMRKDLH